MGLSNFLLYIYIELILSDMDQVERRLSKDTKRSKTTSEEENLVLRKVLSCLQVNGFFVFCVLWFVLHLLLIILIIYIYIYKYI